MCKNNTQSKYLFYVFSILVLLFSVLTSINAQNEEVRNLIQQKNYNDAIKMLEILIEESNGVELQSQYHNQLGEIYYNYTHQYPEALKVYKEILRMEAEGLPTADILLAYIKLGDVYSRMGKYDFAISSFRTLIDITPETHFVHQLGQQRIRDIRMALKDLMLQREILRTYKGTPIQVVALFQIAELYRTQSQLNQPEKAIETYQELLERFPTDKLAAEAQWRIAHIRHTTLHQIPLAISEYQKVAVKYPTSNFAAEGLFHMANLYRETENYKQALTVYNSIVDNHPNFWNMHAVFYSLGICYEELKEYSKALKSYKIFHHVYLPTLDPMYLGQVAMYNKSVSEVEELLQQKIKTLTELIPSKKFDRLMGYAEDGEYDQAIILIRDLIVNNRDTQYGKQAASLLRSYEHLAAIQKLNVYMTEDNLNIAEKIRTQLQIATIYERELMDYSQALDGYREVLEINPKSTYAAEANYRIGIIYSDILEKPNTALKYFNTVIELHKNTLQAMMSTYQVGEIYRRLQRYEEALRAYQTTIGYPERELYLPGGYNDSFADRAQFRIGRVHYEDQRYADARYAFEGFIKNRPNSPRFAAANIYLGDIYQENNDTVKALAYYKKAESVLVDNNVQMEMVLDEAGVFGIHSPDQVIQFLQERIKRLSSD
ncbi:tetratricopeptide repeat protein [Candidatus Poribacteria bacterium]|nr:tetratricopeptide repeat protein [Candidatus Poribacteria bacterium]